MCGVCLFLGITLELRPDIKKIDIIHSMYVPVVFFTTGLQFFHCSKSLCYEAISCCIIIQSTKVQLKLLTMF